jgi:hypothetical protein
MTERKPLKERRICDPSNESTVRSFEWCCWGDKEKPNEEETLKGKQNEQQEQQQLAQDQPKKTYFDLGIEKCNTKYDQAGVFTAYFVKLMITLRLER